MPPARLTTILWRAAVRNQHRRHRVVVGSVRPVSKPNPQGRPTVQHRVAYFRACSSAKATAAPHARSSTHVESPICTRDANGLQYLGGGASPRFWQRHLTVLAVKVKGMKKVAKYINACPAPPIASAVTFIPSSVRNRVPPERRKACHAREAPTMPAHTPARAESRRQLERRSLRFSFSRNALSRRRSHSSAAAASNLADSATAASWPRSARLDIP